MSVSRAKVFVRKEDAYRGRVKLSRGRGKPNAYLFPDGPEGLIRLGKSLMTQCKKHPFLQPGPHNHSLHTVRVEFYQEP